MDKEIIFKNEFFEISKISNDVYIESFKPGATLTEFNQILNNYKDIKIVDFVVLKQTLTHAPSSAKKFARMRGRVEVSCSDNDLNAYITLSVPKEELEDEEKKSKLKDEILDKLYELDIIMGIKHDVLNGPLTNDSEILVAQGTSAIDGEDSIVKKFQIKTIEETLIEKEDFKKSEYNLKLINMVKAGDWLAEVTRATPGKTGISIKGSVVPPTPGKQISLAYDGQTVKAMIQSEKTTFVAKINGVVTYKNDILCVSEHLIVDEDVGVSTGNIDYGGFVTITGTVADNYFVKAEKDIEIMADIGIGGVKEISSLDGSIYIKGGIVGNDKAIIRAEKDIYLKFASNTIIECNGTVHIGFYCFDCNIKAKEVIVSSSKGMISGGSVQVTRKILVPFLGSEAEKKTKVIIQGFNRAKVKIRLDEINNLLLIQTSLKMQIDSYNKLSSTHKLSDSQISELNTLNEEYKKMTENVELCKEERTQLLEFINIKEQGEVDVTKTVFPGVTIQLGDQIIDIDREMPAKTFLCHTL